MEFLVDDYGLLGSSKLGCGWLHGLGGPFVPTIDHAIRLAHSPQGDANEELNKCAKLAGDLTLLKVADTMANVLHELRKSCVIDLVDMDELNLVNNRIFQGHWSPLPYVMMFGASVSTTLRGVPFWHLEQAVSIIHVHARTPQLSGISFGQAQVLLLHMENIGVPCNKCEFDKQLRDLPQTEFENWISRVEADFQARQQRLLGIRRVRQN
jgi:hypothetical protein